MVIRQPLLLTETQDKFDILVNVTGSGPAGQAGAIRHGIARALLEYNGEGIQHVAFACDDLPACWDPCGFSLRIDTWR